MLHLCTFRAKSQKQKPVCAMAVVGLEKKIFHRSPYFCESNHKNISAHQNSKKM